MDEVRSIGSSLDPRSSRYSRSTSSGSISKVNAPSRSPVSHIKVNPPSLESMYINTKTNMLEIIEEGLQLKLEINTIKEQFFDLLQNYDKFEGASAALAPTHTKAMPTSTVTMPTPSSPSKEKGLSAARARVKALYEARKARLQARRSSSAAQGAAPKPSKRRKDDVENKENTPVHPQLHKCTSGRRSSLTPLTKGHSNCVCHPRQSKSNLLTPIKEEVGPRTLRMRQLSQNKPSTLSDIEGDYVTLKSPMDNYIVNMNIDNDTPQKPHQSVQGLNDTSLWVNSVDGLQEPMNATAELSAHDYTGSPHRLLSPGRRESPVKYASSNTISELYTTKNIKDISHISQYDMSLREQVSSTNIGGSVFHSTFNYPLHSTLNYPLNSTISFPDDISPKSNNLSDENDFPGVSSDAQTTISEPSSVFRQKNALAIQRGSLDSSYTDLRSLQRSSRSSSRRDKSRRHSHSVASSKKASTQNSTQLCKEHGLHPTFGGPCIFSNDDSFLLTDDSPEEEVKHRSYMTETDCDSSYLSECMDEGSNFNTGLSEAEEYTATYDARNGRMKMLKRQTAQTELKNGEMRYPIGLSDSDFLDTTHNYTRMLNLNNTQMDATQKHFSLVATRSSLPDLSALSPCASDEEMDVTMREAQAPPSSRSSHKESDASSPNDNTLITIPEQPLTVATPSAETSPDTSLPVPVNSPNVTDSTGSSSKQNTDNYDYVEVPISNKLVKLEQSRLPPRPPCQRASARKRSSQGRSASSTSRSVTSHRSSRDARSHVSHAHSDSPSGPQSRRCLRYHHDCDSGFSTPASLPKHGCHLVISDAEGNRRTVVQHSAVARNLQRERKKALVKKIKKFSNTFHNSTGNLHIRTLGHF